MIDETAFTHHAQPGWLSWDEWSPEEDFCRFVGLLHRVLQPDVTVETGVGVGRLTSHLNIACGVYLGFESNPAWRQPPALPDQATPMAEQLASADLVVLDSDPAFRADEFSCWVEHGKPGSVCVMHDCGNGHEKGSLHLVLRELCQASGLPGSFLRNPRGGWLGWHP